MPEKLQDSLLAIAKDNENISRTQFASSLHRQREARAEKAENAIAMKLQSTKKDLINILYLHQKYFSPRCWKTVHQALDEFKKLMSNKDKLECTKEQILTRCLGLGWEKAHHDIRGQKTKKHLCEIVIPLQDINKVPK